jgi:voltage-gated potassium channel
MPLIKRKHNSAMAYLHDWLEPDEPGKFNFLSGSIVFLVVLSLVSLAIETEVGRADTPLPHVLRDVCNWINTLVVWVFAAEFVLRFISEGENPNHKGFSGHLRFLLSPLGIADLLAFLPELIVMLYFPNLAPPGLAALKALRLFRLFKLARYLSAFDLVGAAMRRSSAALFVTLCVATAQLYVSALLLYFIEGRLNPEAFGSITRALWWSVVTLTTVGYGDVFPETAIGRVAASIVAITGIGIVAMPTGILASAFTDEIRDRREAEAKARAALVEKGGEDI